MIFDVEFKDAPDGLVKMAADVAFDDLNDAADGMVDPTDSDTRKADHFENGAKMAAMAARREVWTIYRLPVDHPDGSHIILYFIGNYGQLRTTIETLREAKP